MGCTKSSSQREVYSNTILPQETRKTLNRLPDFTPKTTGKRRIKLRDYYEQLYGDKMDNLEKMDRLNRKGQSSKTEPGRNRNYEQSNYKH